MPLAMRNLAIAQQRDRHQYFRVMTRSCERHFGQLTEFVDGSRTSNRRQVTRIMARTGVSQELQNSENTIDRILREDL